MRRQPAGLGTTIDELLNFCRKRPEIQAEIRAEVGALAAPGAASGNDHAAKDRENKGDNITFDSGDNERGTGSTYTLKRSKRDRPDLAERVAAGELSANAAAIEAAFRPETITG